MSFLSKKFYSTYWESYPTDFHLKDYLWYYLLKWYLFAAVKKYIDTHHVKELSICDIGGGYGYDNLLLKKLLAFYYPEVTIQVDLIDPNINFYADTTHQKQSFINYHETSFLTMDIAPLKKKYDLIICSEVVEHLWGAEQEVCFSRFNEVLKLGGIVYLTTPNGSSVLKNAFGLRHWKAKNDTYFLCEFNHRYAHIGIPTIFQTLGLFIRKSFKVDHIYPTTLFSGTNLSRFSLIANIPFLWLWRINLFFSCGNVTIAVKDKELDLTQWYNKETFS